MNIYVFVLVSVAVLMTSLVESRNRRSVGTITLSASPRAAVQGFTEEIKLSCKPAPTVKNVYQGLLIHLEKVDENGTTTLVASQRTDSIQIAENNRTSAEGYLQKNLKDTATSFLIVTISNPTVEDAGIYQCRYLYLDTTWNGQSIGSKINISVSEVPPTHYASENACDCPDIWAEIENLKALIAERPAAPQGQSSHQSDDKCHASFSARFATRDGYAIIGEETAIFDHAISNKGDSYDTSTGTFTAPCAGQYFFTATLRTHQERDSGSVDGVIVVDNEPKARTSVFIDAPIDNYQSATNGVVLSLKQGQKVKVVVKTTSTGLFIGDDYSVFSGFYLYP